ncbi:hypothetical protein [Ruminococcus albus]|uniref:Uncharacterized protein n=1 Tax=Ruminococcus albus 8 TaxID=246199 RepID=E9SGE4_RUMAL|nr:hypothetical protein [Ruminococcus albus]EGC01704.1 hypothetical protein CUS_6363 [Ruminococcus albus 8]MCC3350606.1 hypothetical protein [Ruminococcus albus 8]
MFDKQFNFKGRHAARARALSSSYNEAGDQIFARSYDVYLVAPIIGFSYQRAEPLDRSSDEERAVFGDILMKNNADIMFVFRTIMLLDEKNQPDVSERIKKALGNNFSKEDEELFYSYMRGGVDILYEKIIDNATLPSDFVTNLYDFLDEINAREGSVDVDAIKEYCSKFE